MSHSSKIIQVPVPALIGAGVTVTDFLVEEILSLLARMEGHKRPFVRIMLVAHNQAVIIPISELRQFANAIEHLQPNEEVLLVYQKKSGYCVFQYPAGNGEGKVFTITNQRKLKHLARA
jgi:hypothetical protein